MVYLFFFAIILSRLLTFGHLHGASSDEYFYIIIAREMLPVITGSMDGGHLRLVDALHPPLYPYLLACFFRITGQSGLAIARIPGMLLNVGSTIIFYKIALLHFKGIRRALTATALFAFIPALWRDADRAWADNLALFLSTACIYALCLAIDKGRFRSWLASFLLAALLLLTKEYLAVLFFPVIIAVISHRAVACRQFAGGGILVAVLLLILAIAGVWQLCWSPWTAAGYLEQMISPSELLRRSDYLGIRWPDFCKLYVYNLSYRDFPWPYLILMPVLPWGCRRYLSHAGKGSSPGNVDLLHVMLTGVFILYLSLMGHQYGARLLFPAMPSMAILISSAFYLLRGSRMFIPYFLLTAFFAIWSRGVEDTHSLLMSLLLSLFVGLCALLGARSTKLRTARMLPVVITAIFILNSLILLKGDIRLQSAAVARYGYCNGVDRVVARLQKEMQPGDHILSFNPRLTAYLLNFSYHDYASSPWWSESAPLRQAEKAYLDKHNIQWLIVSLPEGERAIKKGIIGQLKRMEHLQMVSCEVDSQGGMAAALFRNKRIENR